MNLESLELFTHSWGKFQEVFLLNGKTCATNGAVYLRVNGLLKEGIIQKKGFIPEEVEKYFEASYSESHLLKEFLTKEDTETCPVCMGTGEYSECPECGGTGEVEWDSGYNWYSAECQSCEGTGKLNGEGEECDNCEGTGKIPVVKRVAIGKWDFSNILLNKLIKALPEETLIHLPKNNDGRNPAILTWADGDGLLMPVRS